MPSGMRSRNGLGKNAHIMEKKHDNTNRNPIINRFIDRSIALSDFELICGTKRALNGVTRENRIVTNKIERLFTAR